MQALRWDQYNQSESCSKRLNAGPILEIKGAIECDF